MIIIGDNDFALIMGVLMTLVVFQTGLLLLLAFRSK